MLPPELNQKYEVRGTLGAGAMGTVYDAVDRIIERRVAIKVVNRPNESDPEAVEAHARFRREAQAAGRLSHPNIVGVYDYGENASQAWIVMELVEGGSLKGRLDKHERFPVPEIVRIMGEVCAALNYSHGRGVVHRDIKPGNIMLTPEGQVKIADFGIARLENSSMTQVGTLIGTPSYMAPEQFRGEPVDLRADIWAAGVMLYQLLTGEKPFEGGFSAVMHKALHTEPPPPSQLSVTTPRGFDAVIARALAKRPEDRYRSAAEFGEAIRNAVNAPATPPEAAGLPGLPGLGEDATIVSARPAGGGAPHPVPTLAPPAGGRKGAPIGLIAGGAGAIAAAAAAGWFFLLGPGAGPDPALLDRQRQEQEARDAADAAAREAAAREAAAREAAARDAAAREQAAREQAARDQAARDQAAAQQRLAAQREQAAREQAAAEAAAREAAAREAAARDQASREQAQRDRAAAEAAAREAAAREQAARDQAARDQAAREQAERDRLAREQAARDQAARDQAAREQAARDQAARDQAARDQAAREQAARDQAERDRIAREQAQQQQVARLDLRAAAQAISASTPCSLIAWSASDRQLTLSGVVRRSDEASIRQELAQRGVPEDAARLDLTPFDGDFCEALDLLRPVLGPAGVPPSVSVIGRQPLQKEELMRLDVTMPDWPAHLYVAYFMHSGEVANLVPSTLQQPSAQIRLGEPQGNFPGWVVDEPYGTDLAVVIASDRPLFGAARPVVEPQAAYLSALAAALRRARANGTRVVVRPVVVETVAHR